MKNIKYHSLWVEKTRKENLRKLVLKMHESSSSSQAKTKGVFKGRKNWIFQNNLRTPGLTQLRREYIAFFGITNRNLFLVYVHSSE